MQKIQLPKRAAALSRYHDKADEINAQSRAKYWSSPHKKTVLSRVWYLKNTKAKTEACKNTMLNTKKVFPTQGKASTTCLHQNLM